MLLTHVQNSTRMRSPEAEQEGLARIAEWGAFHPRVSFYTFPVGSGFWGLPASNTHWVRKLMPELKARGFVGIKLAALAYAGLQPDLYLYMRLLWDADRDVDALLDEYYTTLFGPVAPQVRRYHQIIEASWDKNVVAPGFSDPWRARDRHRAVLDVYEPVVAECRSLLDEALRKAPDEIVRQRVEVFSDNFRLAEMLVEGTRTSGYYGEKPAGRIPPDRARRMIEIASLRKFGRSTGENADIADVGEDQVAAFVAGTASATRSWHHRFSVVRTFYRYAVSRHYVAAAPLPRVIPKRPPPFAPYIYSHDDLLRLLQAVASDPRHRTCLEPITTRTILLLMYGAGLRVREVVSLNNASVDLAASLLTIQQTKFGKTRLVPVGPQLRDILERYASRLSAPLSDAPFFTTRRGARVKIDTLQQNFEFFRQAGRHHPERRNG